MSIRIVQKKIFWQGKRVFVTGGTGFIGSHLAERLAILGAQVILAVRPVSKRYPKENFTTQRTRYTIVPIALEDEQALHSYVKGTDAIFHLATLTGGVLYSSQRHAQMFYANLRPFLSILEAARIASVERFLVCSSACVYPENVQNPICEEDGFRGSPQPTNEGYGWAKRMQEYMGTCYASAYGMHIGIVRLFNVYGPRDHFDSETALVIPALIRKTLSAKESIGIWGTGNAIRSFVYIEDAVEGILAAAENAPPGQAINIGPRDGITIRELAHLITDLCNKPHLRIDFDTTKPEGQLRRIPDTRLAEKLLGFKTQISLNEGLRRTIAWFQTEGQHLTHI